VTMCIIRFSFINDNRSYFRFLSYLFEPQERVTFLWLFYCLGNDAQLIVVYNRDSPKSKIKGGLYP
jgi:hypothetical protein